jgi:hypothetical protein
MVGRIDENDRNWLNHLIPAIVQQYGDRFKGDIDIHVGRTGYLSNHLMPLMDLCADNRIAKRIKLIKHDFKQHNEVVDIFLNAINEYL